MKKIFSIIRNDQIIDSGWKFIMKFNYQNIYLIKRVQVHEKYVSLILHSIFDFLYDYKNHDDFIKDLSHYKVNDLNIRSQSLEEIFLQYYGE